MGKILAGFPYDLREGLTASSKRLNFNYSKGLGDSYPKFPFDPIPDRLCTRCRRWTGGRPWSGSSPEVKAAKTRVHQALLNGGAR
jgi:hypothetical protein